jgi:hypothetical protein
MLTFIMLLEILQAYELANILIFSHDFSISLSFSPSSFYPFLLFQCNLIYYQFNIIVLK